MANAKRAMGKASIVGGLIAIVLVVGGVVALARHLSRARECTRHVAAFGSLQGQLASKDVMPQLRQWKADAEEGRAECLAAGTPSEVAAMNAVLTAIDGRIACATAVESLNAAQSPAAGAASAREVTQATQTLVGRARAARDACATIPEMAGNVVAIDALLKQLDEVLALAGKVKASEPERKTSRLDPESCPSGKVAIDAETGRVVRCTGTAPTSAREVPTLADVFRTYDCSDGRLVVGAFDIDYDPCPSSHLVICSVAARDANAHSEMLRAGCTRASSNRPPIDYCCPALP